MKTKLHLLVLLVVAGLFLIPTQSNAQALLDIATITTNDANGEPDSMDVHCKVRGVVHGINMANNRLDFTLIDGTGGIKIFDYDMFGYTVKEGDELEVVGKVGFFRGLTEMVDLDTVIRLDSNKRLQKPRLETSLGEDDESELVKFQGLWFVTPQSVWKSGNVDVTNGTDTFQIRIDSDTDIDGEVSPMSKFDAVGIGGQYDGSSPYTSGYQLFPQRITDIDSTPYIPRPDYPIGTVTTLDADGRPDSIDVKCRVTGIVYGINFRPGGLTFTLIDNSGGMGVFESSKDLGYTVTEGDSIMVQGAVGFYNGLTQMTKLDSIVVLSQGHMLRDATVVTMLDEVSESNLVTLEKVWVAGSETKWPDNGNIDLTNGTDTFTIRIDRDVDFSDSTIMYDTMNVTGLGGQFDFSAPYTSGYQLFPRYASDIAEWKEPVSIVNVKNASSKLYPNPSTGSFAIESNGKIESISIYNLNGMLIDVQSIGLGTNTVNVDMTNYPKGIYTISLNTTQGMVFSKLVLQ